MFSALHPTKVTDVRLSLRSVPLYKIDDVRRPETLTFRLHYSLCQGPYLHDPRTSDISRETLLLIFSWKGLFRWHPSYSIHSPLYEWYNMPILAAGVCSLADIVYLIHIQHQKDISTIHTSPFVAFPTLHKTTGWTYSLWNVPYRISQ